MNAVRFHGREDLRYEQVPEPECGKGQIKIKPAWCGICGRVRIVKSEPRKEGRERERGIKGLTTAGTVCSLISTTTNSPTWFRFLRGLVLLTPFL